MKYYLAYGPNLNLVQMRQRCPNARVVGYTSVSYTHLTLPTILLV